MIQVTKAQPPNSHSTGSFGTADNMLIRQYQFPAEYDPKLDIMHSEYQ